LRYIPIFLVLAQASTTQGQFTGFGSNSAGSKQQSNDQKAGKLLHEKLPFVLDANTAYPTVPDQDMLGGPFHPRTLPITLGTLTKPLPPGDYVLPMTFFCSEYSVHRGGNGIAYQLGPAQGTAAKAISTLLWRGMLTGHKPQELQSVSWAIQGSVAYDKMPPKYKALVDQLIPDMRNQVNGQAFADIEDGFQGKVNRFTKKVSDSISKGTGGFVHADIKVDVELNQSFERLGQIGRSATDGEKINTIFSAVFPNDQAREQALYAGQGQQSPALPAANGPWSVKVPGVAYMRFVVHGGNLQGDNVMQIRILPPRTSQAQLDEGPHLILAGYEQNQQSTPASPSVISLFNGSVNEAALSQCQAIPVDQQMCMAQAITVSGDTGYSIGAGAQAPIMAPSSPLPVSPVQVAGNDPTLDSQKVCVKKVLYQPTAYPGGAVGLCIYLAVVKNDSNACNISETAAVPPNQTLNWVQTYKTNADSCTPNMPHKDVCTRNRRGEDLKMNGPLYRPDLDPTVGGKNLLFTQGSEFDQWKSALSEMGNLQMLFRDIPSRTPDARNLNLRKDGNSTLQFDWTQQVFRWHTADELPGNAKSNIDNNLRLVRYPSQDTDNNHNGYTPMIEIRYGFRIDAVHNKIIVDPLYIGHLMTTSSATQSQDAVMADSGGTYDLRSLRKLGGSLPAACTITNPNILGTPPPGPASFSYTVP
jgi:hypothetical protein